MSEAIPLPPGPRFTALQILRFMRDEHRFLQECIARYGDPFTAPLGMGDLVVTGHPEGVREIFTADPTHFEPLGHAPLEPLVGENSVLLLGGRRHKRERQLLMPPFHGERMRAYSQLMQELTLRVASTLSREGLFRAQLLIQDISLEIILRAVFGVEEPERMGRFRDVVMAYIESYTPSLMLLVPLRRSFGGLGPWAHFQRQLARLDALLNEQLALRRGQPSSRADILSLLLSARDEAGQPMTDAELKDELRTLLIAGHETTTIGMTWALYWIHRTPEVQQKLVEELASLGTVPDAESLTRLPYLSAVCNEALRISPVAPLLTRRTRVPFTLCGRELPPGTGLMISVPSVHTYPGLYPEPERFRPERFLERRFTPFEFLPFGGGARRCVGAAFALYEMKIVLGTLMAAHRFALAEQGPVGVVRRNAMHCPKGGVRMRYLGPVQGGTPREPGSPPVRPLARPPEAAGADSWPAR